MKRTCLILIIAIVVSLAACTPTVPDEPGTQTPTLSPSASSTLSDLTSPPVGTPVAVPGKWQTLSSGNEVLDLLVNGDEVWAATTGGVVRWNAEDGTYRSYTTLDELASNNAICLMEDSRGNIWFGTYGGVSYYSK